jgi:hypothetical protein
MHTLYVIKKKGGGQNDISLSGDIETIIIRLSVLRVVNTRHELEFMVVYLTFYSVSCSNRIVIPFQRTATCF